MAVVSQESVPSSCDIPWVRSDQQNVAGGACTADGLTTTRLTGPEVSGEDEPLSGGNFILEEWQLLAGSEATRRQAGMPDEEPVEIGNRFEPASHCNVRNSRVRQISQHLAGTRHPEIRQIGTEGFSCMLAEDPAEAVRTERRHPRSIRQSDGLIQILPNVVDCLA